MSMEFTDWLEEKANELEEEVQKKKPQTNADRIRSFSDEELAEFLATLTICELCEYCGEDKCNRTGGDYLCTSAMAAKTMCKWLKSEVKEEL